MTIHGLSERRGGKLVALDRSTFQDHKKLFRLYREEGLAVRRRRGRKRALGTRKPRVVPSSPNERWSLDFVSDRLADGRRFRALCIVDDFSREALAIVPDFSHSGVRVARKLERVVSLRGRPIVIVSDNGTELTRHAVLKWSQEARIDWHDIAPGKPTQKIPSSKASSVGCGTNASRSPYSRYWARRATSLKTGGGPTIRPRRTVRWAACRQASTPASGVLTGMLNVSCFMALRHRP